MHHHPTPPNTGDTISLRAAAYYIGVAEMTLRRWLAFDRHDVPYQRVGGRYRFSKAALEKWLAAGKKHEPDLPPAPGDAEVARRFFRVLRQLEQEVRDAQQS